MAKQQFPSDPMVSLLGAQTKVIVTVRAQDVRVLGMPTLMGQFILSLFWEAPQGYAVNLVFPTRAEAQTLMDKLKEVLGP